MNLIRQPEGSNLCGQACVAMIAGISLKKSIEIFQKKGCTSTRHVVAALRKLGISCGDKLVRLGEVLPWPCIVHIHYPDIKATHWAVFYDGYYLDPALGLVRGYGSYARVTSYLPVGERGAENA